MSGQPEYRSGIPGQQFSFLASNTSVVMLGPDPSISILTPEVNFFRYFNPYTTIMLG
jgi:hypothetical protein